MTSCVVALHTVLDTAEPVTLCCAAVILSVMLCPDIFADLNKQKKGKTKKEGESDRAFKSDYNAGSPGDVHNFAT